MSSWPAARWLGHLSRVLCAFPWAAHYCHLAWFGRIAALAQVTATSSKIGRWDSGIPPTSG